MPNTKNNRHFRVCWVVNGRNSVIRMSYGASICSLDALISHAGPRTTVVYGGSRSSKSSSNEIF